VPARPLIAPASPPTRDDIAESVAHIESLGLLPVLGKYVHEQNGYLAGSDAQRAADFNAMAADAGVRAIVAIRGGYGTMRLLPLLDYEAVRRDPKIVMGFSDLTALLNAVTARSGLVGSGQYKDISRLHPQGRLRIASLCL